MNADKSINNRFKQVRLRLNMSQEEFGKSIGLSKSGVSNIENGERGLRDTYINVICKNFNVNTQWLRTGIGEMFGSQNRTAEITKLVYSLMDSESDSFKSRFISMLARLDEKQWEFLAKMAEEIEKGEKS